jgi:tetratricopeptide (TPR) repeat protein
MTASTFNLDRCYQLFGLRPEASVAEIKTAYRRLARKFHPDLNPDRPRAQEQFTEIDRAYRSLLAKFDLGESVPKIERQPEESRLKWDTYHKLQSLLQQHKFGPAIALVEGMSVRFPEDLHVRQWQGIIYSHFGRELINKQQLDRATVYLHKALKVDPHNRQLQQEVDLALKSIAKT